MLQVGKQYLNKLLIGCIQSYSSLIGIHVHADIWMIELHLLQIGLPDPSFAAVWGYIEDFASILFANRSTHNLSTFGIKYWDFCIR